MSLRIVFSLCFFILLIFGNAQSPLKMKVGYYVRSLKINNKEKNAVIDLYYWYRFKLPEDTSDLSSYYALEVTNGDLLFNEIQEERVTGKNLDSFYVSGHMKGQFNFDADYKYYPFDKQKLKIEIEHPVYATDEVILIPDQESYNKCHIAAHKWGLSKDLHTDGLFANRSGFETNPRVYETDFGDPDIKETSSSYSKLTYYISVSRDYLPYTLKFMLPLMIILSLAYLVFYIPAEALDLAAGLTVTSLLAGIAFQWTISDDLPEVGYLTCVDRIFYLSYVLISIAMIQTIWTYHLELNKNFRLSNILEIGGRWLFPILFFGGSAYFILSAIHST